jgi:hypothetical protein
MAKTTHGVEAPEPGAQLNFASMWKMPPGFRRRRSAVALKKEDLFKQAVTEMTGRQSKPLPAFRRSQEPRSRMIEEMGSSRVCSVNSSDPSAMIQTHPWSMRQGHSHTRTLGDPPIIGVFWPETI